MTQRHLDKKIIRTKHKLHKLLALKIAKNWNKTYLLEVCKLPRWAG